MQLTGAEPGRPSNLVCTAAASEQVSRRQCHPRSEQALVLPQEPHIGLGIVVLDALTRREWVLEDDFAGELKVSVKVMHRVLRYFEQVGRPGSP